MTEKSSEFTKLDQKIVNCNRCPRLRRHCLKIANEKRRQFIEETYWGKPVPGFGDSNAKILIVGLAPAAHGANRTGRMFTGDQSGVWLYRALFRAGFANREESISREDSLKLKKVYITAAARCAPPENKPTLQEIQNCSEYLQMEIELLTRLKVYICLGQIALKTLWSELTESVKPTRAVPKFTHGGIVKLTDGRLVLCSYHPSQQNTFTKRLTEPMFDAIFEKAKELIA